MEDKIVEQFHEQERLNNTESPTVLFERGRKRRKKVMLTLLIAIIFAESFFTLQYSSYSNQNHFSIRIQREQEIQNTGFIKLTTGQYTGDTDFGIFSGKGTFQFNNGSKLDGTWKNNLLSGKGNLLTVDKGKYKGEFESSKKNGKGTFTWDNGAVYTGEWKNDKINGSGEYIDSSVHYKGVFSNNTFTSGVCDFENDLGKYKLTYKNGKVEDASITFKNGCIYKGEATDEQIKGTGVLQYPSGDKYSGRFVNGNREGNGVYTWSTGDSYDGSWHKDHMTGSGVYTYTNGNTLNGTFQNNNFIDGSYHVENEFGDYQFSIKNGEPTGVSLTLADGTTYEGDMNEEGLNGSAQIKYSNGDTYSGNVSNGVKSGQGQYHWNNGASYDGEWSNDKIEGTGTYKYPSDEEGYELTGSFSDGMPNGECQYYTDGTTSYKTTWNNGTCVKVEE